MNKGSSFRMFRKSQTFWLRASSLAYSVRKLMLFSLFSLAGSAILQTPSANYFSSQTFAQSSAEQITPQESHRLENFLISIKGRDDWTRLMLAILNSVSAVESVLSTGVSVNIRGTEEFHGVTPLMFASGIGAQVIVKLLVEKGARLNDTDTLGKTALIQAAHKGHPDTVSFLLQQGANPNAETNQQWTALMFAAERGELEILKTLLRHGARADFQNKLSMSSAMYAAQNGHFEIVQFLLKRGIKVDLTSLNGSTALIWAIRSGHEKIA
ncbi:MAG: ankyrin repeat domain-containing protein, partial [SAR324 cluster bacterium]|nr:ankyrin repeat domain-containing protein [SAR324 cluster bacterium]